MKVVADTREPDATEMYTNIKNAINAETYNSASLKLRTMTIDGPLQPSQYTAVTNALRLAWNSILR